MLRSLMLVVVAASSLVMSGASAAHGGQVPGNQAKPWGGKAVSAAAALRCARWASDAGFPNNGYLGGSLTDVVAIGLAESGCDATSCWDVTIGKACAEPGAGPTRTDSIDRGAWQLNSVTWSAVSNSCAYNGPCSARAAYVPVSEYGSSFEPWPSYRGDTYASFLWPAQQAVNALRHGTVTSALIGSCLAFPTDAAGATARLANCGSGAADQIWTASGNTLRTGRGMCLTVTSRDANGPVDLALCDGSKTQQWRQGPGSTLYNPAARRCLTDPGSSLTPGVVLAATGCQDTQNEAWFRP
jgi:hypothetical protein